MKNILFICAFFSLSTFASTEVERSYGAFGGLSLSSISYANGMDSSYRKGVNLGLDYEFPVSKHIYLDPSFYVVEKGEENAQGTVRLNYLEMAFSAKFKTSTDSTGFYFLLGPYLSTILSSTTVTNDGTVTSLGSDQVRTTEGGILGGLGFEFLVSHHWTVYLEGKYAMGLASSLEALNGTNNSFYFNIGFHYLDREDLNTNFDRAEEFVKEKATLPTAAGEQSIQPGNQDPFQEPTKN